MNLENLGVQEMDAQEVINVDGGYYPLVNVESSIHMMDATWSFIQGFTVGLFF